MGVKGQGQVLVVGAKVGSPGRIESPGASQSRVEGSGRLGSPGRESRV